MRKLALILSLLLIVGCQDKPAPVAKSADGVKTIDQMRLLWNPAEKGCIRDWLLLGPIAFTPDPVAAAAATTQPANAYPGLGTDYLSAVGGEAKVDPKAGMACKLSDGRTLTWTAAPASDVIDFHKVLCGGEQLSNQVAYAYVTYNATKAGKVLLAAGSDDGIRVWVHGKLVQDHPAGRALLMDEDVFQVDVVAGVNKFMVKIDQGGGRWEFCLRVVEQPDTFVLTREVMAAAIVEPTPAQAGSLIVQTDLVPVIPNAADVKIDAIAPGGKVLASQTVKRGETATFKTADWPEGPCEIQLVTFIANGKRISRVLQYYKGDHVAQARKVIEVAKSVKADSAEPRDLIVKMMGEYLQMQFDRQKDPAKTPVSWVHSALMEFQELQMSAGGADVRVRPGGFVRLAWVDEVDGSAQFARAYLPPDYDPSKKWPLVINMHGYNAENQVYWDGWGSWDRQNWANIAQSWPAVVVEPMGRYNTGYQGIGELDVLRSIAEAKKSFKIDDDRVLLIGFSMGGGGTWHVGTRHPELFAGIAPVYGGWDWHSGKNAPDPAKMSPGQTFMADRSSSFACAENLLTTPIFVNHGDIDDLVDVNHSRYVLRMLQRWGYDIRYWEHPGFGHGGFESSDEVMRWFLALKRDANPRQVRVRAGWLKDASAQWVRVQQSADQFQFINATAEIVGPNMVNLQTENVLEIALSPTGPMIDQAKPLRVIWNNKPQADAKFVSGKVVLRAAGYEPTGLVKRPLLAGPVADAQTMPFAIVIGTISPDPLMKKMIAYRADVAIRGWQEWQHCRPRAFKDTEITPDDMKKYTLVLLGGPADNAVTKQLADKLPLKIDGKTIMIDGRSFSEPDAAVQMVYPHPLNPDRYVVVMAANSPAGMYMGTFPDECDYCVMDGRIANDGDGRPFDKVALGMGVFDNAWRFDPKLADFGDAAVRAKCPLRKAPRIVSAAINDRGLALADLLESMAVGSFTNMQRGIGADGKALRLGGKTYDDGIGVEVWRDKSAAEYDISGGGWKHLTGLVGIDVGDATKLTQVNKDNTVVVFVVTGDGKELFRSQKMRWDSQPQAMNVDISGVKSLSLQVYCENVWFYQVDSANWVNLRLGK